MNPRSLSATALDVAAQCLSRYHAEHIVYGRDFQGSAANVGIVCHGTLEDWLRLLCIKKEVEWEDEARFVSLFNENFQRVFGADRSIPEYEDALDLCMNWYNREDQDVYFRGVRVLSLESKLTYDLPVMVDGKKATKPFNYVMDRVDRIAPGHYRVVDYKSNRVPLTSTQLRTKRQAKYYALMIQIRFPDAKKIEVEFDFLRHRPVMTTFTREDNVATWRQLRAEAQRILDASDRNIPETLNPNCGWCVRKSSCKTLLSNVEAGGIMSKDVDALARLHVDISSRQKAQKELLDQVELMLLQYAIETNELEFETDAANVTVIASTRRKVDSTWVAGVLGEQASEHANYTATTVDKLLRKSSPLTEKQKSLLRKGAFVVEMSDPRVRVEMKDAPE